MTPRALLPGCLAAALLLATAAAIPAQTADPAESAVDSLTAVIRAEPANGRAHLRLAQNLMILGRLDAAETAYRRADSLGFARLVARYNLRPGAANPTRHAPGWAAPSPRATATSRRSPPTPTSARCTARRSTTRSSPAPGLKATRARRTRGFAPSTSGSARGT
jgi:hypothetical protein